MKKIFLLFILIATQSIAQVTLTSTNNPVAGDADRNAMCDTSNISQGNSGANQTWNFTSLIRQDSTSINFVTASSTPYSAQFPTSNIASTNDNANYSYFTTSQTDLLVNGYGGQTFVVSYSDPQRYMQYPFTFNSSFNDNFAANYLLNGVETVRTGTSTVTGDAWGTIVLPSGSFTNALRVKYVISTKDSSNPGIPIVSITDLTSYVWFVPGKKFPVFEIIYTTISFNGTPLASSKVVNYGLNSSTGINTISNEVPSQYTLSQNYPNPFNPVTKFRFSIPKSGMVKVTVYNAAGKEIESLVNGQLQNGTYEVDWNASNYSSGIYFYKLVSGGFIETKKMIFSK